MTTLQYDAALGVVLAHSKPLATRRVAPSEALSAVLTEDVIAQQPHPPFAASIKDGYALLASPGVREFVVVGANRAGQPGQSSLGVGEAVYITTGAPLPAGADCVVQIEHVQHLGPQLPAGAVERIRVESDPQRGQEVRPIGSDIGKGAVVLHAGQRIGAAEIGLLATLGCSVVSVGSRPVVAVLSTGDELVDTLDSTAPSKLDGSAIFDSNRPATLAAATLEGAVTIDLGIAADRLEALEAALERALQSDADVLICSGGVSMGDRDLVKPLLSRHGTVHFGKVNLKPGKPLTFATVPRVEPAHSLRQRPPMLVFGLPGNPVSSFVCFQLVVAPALRALTSDPQPRPRRVSAQLASAFRLDPERPEFHRVVLSSTPTGFVAHSTGGQISSRLMSCIGADALVELPPGSAHDRSVILAGSQLRRTPPHSNAHVFRISTDTQHRRPPCKGLERIFLSTQ